MNELSPDSVSDPMDESRVAVVIAAWNQSALTQKCLDSVVQQTGIHPTLFVIDNGSQPPLEQLLEINIPPANFTLLRHADNLGFAGGYNAGLKQALQGRFDYIFLLNNDVVLAPDCLIEMIKAAGAADVGLVSAKIFLADKPDRIWSVGQTFNPWLLELRKSEPKQHNTVADPNIYKEFFPLCVVLLKRETLEDIGLLDEGFFVYYEDLDYCQRLKKHCWRCRLAPDAQAWHAVSASSGGKNTPFARYWSAQASGRYFRKHGGWRLLLIVPYRLASALKFSFLMTIRLDFRPFGAYWLGLWRGWFTGRADIPPPGWVKTTSERTD